MKTLLPISNISKVVNCLICLLEARKLGLQAISWISRYEICMKIQTRWPTTPRERNDDRPDCARGEMLKWPRILVVRLVKESKDKVTACAPAKLPIKRLVISNCFKTLDQIFFPFNFSSNEITILTTVDGTRLFHFKLGSIVPYSPCKTATKGFGNLISCIVIYCPTR